MTGLRDEAAKNTYDQMVGEHLQEEAQERESIRSAFIESLEPEGKQHHHQEEEKESQDQQQQQFLEQQLLLQQLQEQQRQIEYERYSMEQERQQLNEMMHQFQERASNGMNIVEQFKKNSQGLREETNALRMSRGPFSGLQGQMVESILLDNSSQQFNAPIAAPSNQSAGHLRHGGGSLDDTLAISQAHMDSFEFQNSIETKRLRTHNSGFQEDQIEIRQPRGMMMMSNEDLEKKKLEEEMIAIRNEMRLKNTSKMTEAMGSMVGTVKKVQTRELSRLFRSKREIYQILVIEGQFYLPPFEECTIDFLRALFSGQKKVSPL